MPALRQDLALHPGPDAPDGSPTWTLHDPAANRFYELAWPAFELLSRWRLGSVQAVLNSVRHETTLQVEPGDVEDLLRMLAGNHLLVARSAQQSAELAAQASAARPGVGGWLLRNYLFFRVPLVRPMHGLRRLAPWVRWAFSPLFWAAITGLSVLGLLLALRRWDEFTHSFVAFANWQGLLAIGVAVSFAKVLHELGHACAATRFGCRVPTMGLAFVVMWPMLYTDTNEAWKLRSRRQRLAIGAAGMASEFALAAVALLLWSVLPATPDWQPVRSGAFLLATTTWVLTLALNASPFMRFDGYFLLADALNLPNLHERSFALARWWLRERLFGTGQPAPELFTPGRAAGLIAFAIATWLYRLALFLAIALLVYHFFFKALGLLLMAVELGWFIARPVARELSHWWRERGALRWNRAMRRTALAVGAGVVLLLLPWQETVRAPALLAPRQSQALYAPYAAQLQEKLPAAGQAVAAGAALARLRSPDLAARLALADAREQQLRWQVQQQPFDVQLMEAGPALRTRWESAVEEVAGLREEIRRLTLVAPFAGVVVDAAEDAQPGSWIAGGERLLQVAGLQGAKVDAFVDEGALAGLASGTAALFVPEALEAASVRCKLQAADGLQLAVLDTPALASPHGGAIPAQRMPDGQLQPLQPTFRVRLTDCEGSAPRRELMGTAHLHGERRSIAQDAMRRAAALWHREAGL